MAAPAPPRAMRAALSALVLCSLLVRAQPAAVVTWTNDPAPTRAHLVALRSAWDFGHVPEGTPLIVLQGVRPDMLATQRYSLGEGAPRATAVALGTNNRAAAVGALAPFANHTVLYLSQNSFVRHTLGTADAARASPVCAPPHILSGIPIASRAVVLFDPGSAEFAALMARADAEAKQQQDPTLSARLLSRYSVQEGTFGRGRQARDSLFPILFRNETCDLGTEWGAHAETKHLEPRSTVFSDARVVDYGTHAPPSDWREIPLRVDTHWEWWVLSRKVPRAPNSNAPARAALLLLLGGLVPVFIGVVAGLLVYAALMKRFSFLIPTSTQPFWGTGVLLTYGAWGVPILLTNLWSSDTGVLAGVAMFITLFVAWNWTFLGPFALWIVGRGFATDNCSVPEKPRILPDDVPNNRWYYLLLGYTLPALFWSLQNIFLLFLSSPFPFEVRRLLVNKVFGEAARLFFSIFVLVAFKMWYTDSVNYGRRRRRRKGGSRPGWQPILPVKTR